MSRDHPVRDAYHKWGETAEKKLKLPAYRPYFGTHPPVRHMGSTHGSTADVARSIIQALFAIAKPAGRPKADNRKFGVGRGSQSSNLWR